MAASCSESLPVLRAGSERAGFVEADRNKIEAAVKSLKQLAFVSSFTPGATDEAPLIRALEDMLGGNPNLAQKAAFGAVVREAYAIVAAEMRQHVERFEELSVRRLS